MKRWYSLFISLLLLGCANADSSSNYLRWVGDSVYDPAIDSKSFELCHEESVVKQYFNFSQGMKYEGEKKTLVDQIMSQYKPVNKGESGWIRIRFVVNCHGETGRFRLTGADEDYNAQIFNEKITDQLMRIVQALDGWQVLPNPDAPEDYYQYLVFKLEDGNIVEILP